MNSFLLAVIALLLTGLPFFAYAAPEAPINIPDLLAASDLVVAGRMELHTSDLPGGTRVKTLIFATRLIKGSGINNKELIDLGYADTPVAAYKLPFSKAFGIFFLKRKGTIYTFAASNLQRIVAAPPTFEQFPMQESPEREISAELASIFAIPADLIADPALGLKLSNRMIVWGPGSTDDMPIFERASRVRLAESVYKMASDALKSISNSDKLPYLKAIFDGHASQIGRMQALAAIMRAGDATRIQAALPYLMHPDEEARVTNVELMVGLQHFKGRDDLVPLSISLLDSTNYRVREAAVQIFADSRRSVVRSALERALKDPDEQVRESAVFGVCNRSRACKPERPSTLAMPENIPSVITTLRTESGFDP